MSVKLLAEQHLEFLSLKIGCTGLSESTLVKMPHCWKSHVVAHRVDAKTSVSTFFSHIRSVPEFNQSLLLAEDRE